MKLIFSCLFLAAASFAHAANPAPPAVKTEINALLAKLETGGCEFNRNGSWYNAAEAKTHLLRKLDYLEGKGMIKTTEQFIELGGSKSSSSDKVYQVRCTGVAAMESKTWLSARLVEVRAAPAPAPTATK